ncbi:MAG: magnesium transporter [Desulfobulbaceae bacterium]|nr:magnesium transporter [Desulfobulbaceae bacterium]
MTMLPENAVAALNKDYLERFSNEAFRTLSRAPSGEIVEILQDLPLMKSIDLWDHLHPDVVENVIDKIPEGLLREFFMRSEPVSASRTLSRLQKEKQHFCMGLLSAEKQSEIRQLLEYPENSAGRLMDSRFLVFRSDTPTKFAHRKIRDKKPRFSKQIFLVDENEIPERMIEIQDLALAAPDDILGDFARPLPAVAFMTTTRDEVIDLFSKHKITDLPVVDNEKRILGVIRYDSLVDAVREEASIDIQTMVGASKDESALSSAGLVVRKRLPWLQINLLTAFLAAAVVGLFENLIAQFTALAVLLPVVAGQSGNTGAQALAVTMRGLALHEIGTSQWKRVMSKEIKASLVNGFAVALTTAIAVFLWSNSYGLALVITISMVIAMIAAAISGVFIPILLRKLGQDPAQSSSIILTTVTDVTGFFAFLGIATVLSGML